MSNIMMGIVAEMLAAHGAKPDAEQAPVEGSEGIHDALPAEVEETFAAVLAQNPAAKPKAPASVSLPEVSVGQRNQTEITERLEQGPVRADNRSAHSAPRIPFEAMEVPKSPAPEKAVEAETVEAPFVTVSPEATDHVGKVEDAPITLQTTDKPVSHAPTADTTSPVATPVAALVASPAVTADQPPAHATTPPTAETEPAQQRPIVDGTPTPPRVVDPISAELKPRDLPRGGPEKSTPTADPIEVNNGAGRMNPPVESSQEGPNVSGANQDTDRPEVDLPGPSPSHAMIGAPITSPATQNAIPHVPAQSTRTPPDEPDTDPTPVKGSQTDTPDLDARVAVVHTATPTAPPPTQIADVVSVSAETGPLHPKPNTDEPPLAPELADDSRNGADTTPPADSAPTPSNVSAPPPSTVQTPTPQAAALTAIDLPQVEGSAPTLATTPPAPTEVDVPPVAQQVAIAVSKSDGGTIELALRPVELGETQISMEFEAERLVVTVATERAETQDLMRRQIDDLAREFRDLGYRDVSFRFEQQTGHQGQSRQAQGEPQNANQGDLEPDLSSETPAPRPTHVSGRLDIRL